MVLTKDQIIAVEDLKTEELEVPEWGGSVIVRTMTGIERDKFEESVFISKGKDVKANFKNFRAKLCAVCMVDEKGQRLFTDADIDLLGKKSAKALDTVFTVAQRLNAIGPKEVEDLTKNLETDSELSTSS